MMSLTGEDLLWLAQKLGEFGWSSAQSDGFENLPLHLGEKATLRLAEAHCLFEHRIEYGREVARRRVDDLQYLGGRGLLSERLVALGQRVIQVPLRVVPLGSALVELASKVGNDLLW